MIFFICRSGSHSRRAVSNSFDYLLSVVLKFVSVYIHRWSNYAATINKHTWLLLTEHTLNVNSGFYAAFVFIILCVLFMYRQNGIVSQNKCILFACVSFTKYHCLVWRHSDDIWAYTFHNPLWTFDIHSWLWKV